jgi:ankyrin repeat protein
LTSKPASHPKKPPRELVDAPSFPNGNAYLHELCSRNAPLELVIEAVDALGADLNRVNQNNMSALALAAEHASLPIVEFLLQRGAAVFYPATTPKGEKSCVNACHIAATRGDYAILSVILGAGGAAHINQESIDVHGNLEGHPPLHAAARRGHATLIPLLIAMGARTDAIDRKTGQTALHAAAHNKQPHTAVNLILGGAPVDILNAEGQTPLHRAAYFDMPQTAAALVRFGANVEHRDAAGRTPLYLAVEALSPQTVKVLLDLGADPNTRKADFPEMTALICASKAGQFAIVQHLVAAGADVLLTDRFKMTAARHAADGGTSNSMVENAAGTRVPQPVTYLKDKEDRAFAVFFEKAYRKHRPG